MIILSIRSDKPDAEIGLYDNSQQLAFDTWEAHRELAETIHKRIDKLLKGQHRDWSDIEGVVCYRGPGSFTGLRIGLSVANSLSYALGAPIIATEGDNWLRYGLTKILNGNDDTIALPEYGSPPHVTKPRK